MPNLVELGTDDALHCILNFYIMNGGVYMYPQTIDGATQQLANFDESKFGYEDLRNLTSQPTFIHPDYYITAEHQLVERYDEIYTEFMYLLDEIKEPSFILMLPPAIGSTFGSSGFIYDPFNSLNY